MSFGLQKAGGLQALRLDSYEVGAFMRQLEDLEARIEREETPELRFQSGELVPLDIQNKPWAQYWTYRQVRHVGHFKLATTYSTDIPMVDVMFKEFRRKIYRWDGGYYYNEDEIAAVTRMGESIEQEKIYAVNEASRQTLNKLIAYGDDSIAMPGFIDHPDCLRSYAPFPLNASSDAEQQLSVLNACANSIPNTTNQVEKPDTMLFDSITYQHLSSSIIRIGTTALNKTVLSHFLETNPYIKNIDTCNELDPDVQRLVGVQNPSRRIIAYNRNPQKIKAKIYMPLTFKDPKRMGVDSYARPASMKYAGIDLRRPYSMHIMELPE